MNKQILAILFGCASAATALHADTVHWTGTTDADFWNLSNWTHYEWTGSENHFWEIGNIDEVLSGDVSLNDYYNWRFPNNSGYVVDLGGRIATLAGKVDVVAKAEHPIVLCNGVIDMTESGQPFRVNPSDSERPSLLVISNMTLNVSNLYVGGNGWSGNGTGAVHQVESVVNADSIELSRGNYSVGSYVIESGSATFGRFYFGGSPNWPSASTNAYVVLNGGILTVPAFEKIEHGCVSPELLLNGGTLKASGASTHFVPDWLATTIGEGGAVIDSNGFDITIEPTLVAEEYDGGLTKTGNGTLKVTGGKTWSGPTKVLCGTLDLNGSTLEGDVVLGGDGKIVNFVKGEITSLTIVDGYAVDVAFWDADKVVVGGGAVTAKAPLSALLDSASVWYDPSDETTLTKDKNGDVTAIANKGADGSSMDAALEDNGAGGFVSLGEINGLAALSLTNQPAFKTSKNHAFARDNGRAVFAVAQLRNRWDSVNPAEWGRGDWGYDSTCAFRITVAGWEDGKQNQFYARLNDGETTKWEGHFAGFNSGNTTYVRSLNALDGELTGSASGWENDALVTDSVAGSYGELDITEANMRVCYGFCRSSNGNSSGLVGEALYFDRGLESDEIALVTHYLARKWLAGNTLEEDLGLVSIPELELDNCTMGFSGAAVAVGDIAGMGTMADIASLTVTGTITAKLVSDGAAIAVSAPLDLTGTTLVLDESAFALSQVGDTATVFTASSITGVPEIQLASEDKRKIKVRNTGTAITVTRLNPGFAVIVR